ncbi:hypothetical protein ABMA27_006399 [Loxostege sticticalis]|uniref:Uncharacterized protein n=1 Tax=Loxostege sticticalis TaxID=481309 RepID=A0ABR3IJ19_LOXSC
MSFVKILDGEHLDEMSYVGMRDHAKLAIERIRKFTKSYEFEVADDILLEIKLGTLEMNFERFMQCNTLLVSINSANDISESMEDIYTEIKMELMTKQRCNSQNDNGYNGSSEPKKKEEETEKELPKELYKNIVQANRGHGDIITSVVNRLAQEGNRNLLSYVYRLWLSGQNEILQYMPKPIQAIFSEWVILKQKKFGLPLKMDVKTDSDGDRVVWGDASDKRSLRVNWKLIPFWENNCVFFHAQNMEHNMFLKLEVKPDGIGDRGAFGSTDSGTTRHDWILEPVVIDGEVFFYIVNREYNQGLKLAMSTDSLGDRKLWGHHGDFHREPSHFAWSIKKEEETEKELSDPEELYKNIVQAKYSDAVNVTKDISSRGHGDIITSVVNRLAQEGNRNLLSYVYQLWLSGQNDILQHTPKPIQAIFSEWVILKQKKFGLPLKMDVKTDSDGDRVVWGDASDKRSLRVNWKLIPFWENNCVFFHAQNMEHNMFLKLEVKPDSIGDRGAFGSTDSGTTRHDWILEPVVIDGEVFFYIVNREYNQGLKLAMSTDSLGDRKLWGHNGDFHREPSHFAWSINLNLKC